MLELIDLQHAYGEQTVLRMPPTHLEPGEQVAVVGPSGCGKTTLLHVVAGLLQPTHGQVIMQGQDVYALSASQRDRFRGRQVGIVFQKLHLLPALTLRQNLLLAQRLAGAAQDHPAVDALIADLGLADLHYKKPAQLSLGQAQRAAVARALVHKPALLLADEPTSSLDAANADRVLTLLKVHAQLAGATLLVVTHDQRLQGQLDRDIVLGGDA
nr:ATP-binding cassette domain-containing protein [Oceanococcus sp. HetDA_MAG_MS8]